MRARAILAAVCLLLAARAPQAESAEQPLSTLDPDARLIRLTEYQKSGRWREADDGFRALMRDEHPRTKAEMTLLIGFWKGFAVAGNTFVQALLDESARAEAYESFGERLLAQGLASLAAVEFERASALGDTSEEIYVSLLECYGLNGDTKAFQRTLALLRSHHPASAVVARRPTIRHRDAAAAVDYPQWIAWGFQIGVQGYHDVNPVWRGGRIVYPRPPGANEAAVRSWSPETGRVDWEFDASAELPGKEGRTTWRSRTLIDLSDGGRSFQVRYREMLNTARPGGGSGGHAIGWGTFILDPRTGKVLEHERRADDPERQDYSKPCKGLTGLDLGARCIGAIRRQDYAFLLLEDLTALRADLTTRRIIWRSRVSDAPRTTLYLHGDTILIPGANRTLSALDARNGKPLWKYPIATNAPIDVSGPDIIVISGAESKGLALRPPEELAERRAAIVEAAKRQKDADLAEEILVNALDGDPSNALAYIALADLHERRLPLDPIKGVLMRYSDLLEPDDPAYARLQRYLGAQTSVRWSARAGSERISGLAFDRRRSYIMSKRLLVAVENDSGEQAWTLEVGAPGVGEMSAFGHRLAFAGGRLYLFTGDGGIMAVDAVTGKRAWSKVRADPSATWSTLESPLAERDRVFGSRVSWQPDVSTTSPQLEFFALRQDDGAEIWRTSIDSQDDRFRNGGPYIDLRPTRAHGRVYFPTPAGGLYALDEETGRVVWNFKLERSTEALMLATTRPLVIGRGVHFMGENGVLYSLDSRTGKPRWKRRISPPKGAWAMFDSLSRFGDRLCLRLTYGSDFGCLDSATGEPLWRREGFFFQYRPIEVRGAIVVSRWANAAMTADEIVALDPKTGEIKGERSFPGIKHLTSIRTDGDRLYLVHDNTVTQVAPFW